MSVRTRTRRTAAVLLGACLLAAATTACGPDNSVSTTPKAAASTPASGSAAAPADKPATGSVAKLGDTIGLKGTEKSNTADVTLVKVVDNAEGADEYTKAADGKRFVSVQFRIKATGSAAYADAPANSAKVLDAQGQGYGSTVAETKAGPEFPVPANIAPGETALGFITFEVPADAKLDKIQFALDSGFAQQTGQWKL
ncbi:DUF4352 domain-containing protein [Kitasatospora cheerisanensis]|uniref:DUF4352 domain-containing protein n=1 Tax=Kitasatospora cheerisanensis KCTC 2395 TaxID=1348663 RepID=A0A066YZ62_9ACTN|nr:DUF4352 domain-containing protein [Kitasatospora cheerisanensis]KDN83175.1 hypothetical protein KCH_46570 [Kitasatospora cheerisanensis KCTC 2395]